SVSGSRSRRDESGRNPTKTNAPSESRLTTRSPKARREAEGVRTVRHSPAEGGPPPSALPCARAKLAATSAATKESAAENRVELSIRGMHCAGCASTVEAALKRVPGVAGAEVSFAAGLAVVQTRDGTAPLAALAEAVRAAGYSAAAAGATADRAQLRAETRELVAALALAAVAIGVSLL